MTTSGNISPCDRTPGAKRRGLLIVITGPTASGKTSLAIEVARRYGTEIISADSRQMFREIPIGTAAPTAEELAAVPHHFIGNLHLTDYYSAAIYEKEAMAAIHDVMDRCSGMTIMCGGSMMYIDAVCHGIDEMPDVSDDIRAFATGIWEKEGLHGLICRLQQTDPEYLANAPDLHNHKRLIHALEVSLEAGVPYSSLLGKEKKPRPFDILKFTVDYPREQLYDRINRRVEIMIEDGLVEEARSVYHLRHLNSLNTVGYKELFTLFDNVASGLSAHIAPNLRSGAILDLPSAISRIQKNTRVYARKQLFWLARDPSVIHLNPQLPLLAQIEQAVDARSQQPV